MDAESLGRSLFMTWEQVRQLADSNAGLTIGSHGHSHQRLARLDDDSQRSDLAESKRILEARLGREVAALAYPYGWPGTYTAETKALAAGAGYRLAFASREGTNRPGTSLDRYEISRLGVGSGDSAPLLRAGRRSTPHSASPSYENSSAAETVFLPARFKLGAKRVAACRWGGHSCPPQGPAADKNVRPTKLSPNFEPCLPS